MGTSTHVSIPCTYKQECQTGSIKIKLRKCWINSNVEVEEVQDLILTIGQIKRLSMKRLSIHRLCISVTEF